MGVLAAVSGDGMEAHEMGASTVGVGDVERGPDRISGRVAEPVDEGVDLRYVLPADRRDDRDQALHQRGSSSSLTMRR
jgi:hypothetical protein